MARHRLTEDAVNRLNAELHDLETAGRGRIQERIQAAREEGDLRENAEYHEAKEDQGFLEGRIAEIRSILDDHEILDTSGHDGETVDIGVVVTLRDQDGDEDAFVYSSTLEDVDLPVISPESPLGRALAGQRAGDSVSYEAPAGTLKVEILSIERR